MHSKLHHPLPLRWTLLLLGLLLVFPLAAGHLEQEFYIGVASRLMIYALAASSLNLILGFGGMVSLGHAAFFGAGAYAIGILMQNDVMSGWIGWPVAMATGALLALLIGAISLRTRGVYFIMITLAFAQMMYYFFISLEQYGGEDGMSLMERSGFGFDLSTDTAFYYLVLATCAGALLLLHRLVNSRFGRVVQAIRENETRMEAIGYPVMRYKLVCFVIGGALAALAGAMIANQNMMVTPDLVHWTQSGILMVMVILGGVGYFSGGLLGAVVFLLLEEVLSGYTMHWQLALGVILLAVVLLLPNGLAGLLQRFTKRGVEA
jgi:branched-chain amino acid transport system permease protein